MTNGSANTIELSKIAVASQTARVALLVRFSRSELLPSLNFGRIVELFLAN